MRLIGWSIVLRFVEVVICDGWNGGDGIVLRMKGIW